jgi:uncharacterized membrane protein
VVLVGIAGILLHRPLSAVPENTMKFAVGLLLSSFGMFWGAEGAGVVWPGADGAILVLLAFLALLSLGLTSWLREHRGGTLTTA